ncbi:hypothetical protein T11_15428 [Trichinella zimbabwensis]|uniref:Uncharacterized protein n=1 Tax=Trichinella zimbabwensis TaxID=268475 RepID=A0A0V1HP78_9BILA|nr:hypothetical protein T11_15428 [Trichinella zimbabwensis]
MSHLNIVVGKSDTLQRRDSASSGFVGPCRRQGCGKFSARLETGVVCRQFDANHRFAIFIERIKLASFTCLPRSPVSPAKPTHISASIIFKLRQFLHVSHLQPLTFSPMN